MLDLKKDILEKQIIEILIPLSEKERDQLAEKVNFCCPHPCGECCHEKNIQQLLYLEYKLIGQKNLPHSPNDLRIKIHISTIEIRKITQYITKKYPQHIGLYKRIYKDWDQKYYFDIDGLCPFNQNKKCLLPIDIRPKSCLLFLCPEALQTILKTIKKAVSE